MDLRANTAVDVLIGPFVDKGDGNTTEDGLTLPQAEIKLSKNGQALAQKNDNTSAAFDDDGYYNCELNTTDTNTEGNLVLIVHQSANALPVRHEFNVLAEAAWDSLYAAKDSGLMSVDATTIEDSDATDAIQAAVDAALVANHLDHLLKTAYDPASKPGAADALFNELIESDAGVSRYTTNALEQARGTNNANTSKTGYALSTAGILAIWHQLVASVSDADTMGTLLKTEITSARMATLTDWINGGRLDLILDQINDSVAEHRTTIATLATQVSFTLTAGSTDDDAYEDWLIIVQDQNTAVQKARGWVDTYAGGSKRITLHEALAFTIATGDIVKLIPDIAAASVWDRVLTGATHNIATSAGRRLRGIQEFQGYANGAVWIDTIGGTAGTTPFENGTVERPVLSIADANTIATGLNLLRFTVAPKSSITLPGSQDGQIFLGEHWTLLLANRSISDTAIFGADVSGVATGAAKPHFERCEIGAVTLPACHIHNCILAGLITLADAGAYHMESTHCMSGAILDYGAGVANTTVLVQKMSGDIEVRNMGQNGTDVLYIEGTGKLTINANCIGGTINIRGGGIELANNGSGQTINDNGRIDTGQINAQVLDVMNVDTFAEPGQGTPAATASIFTKIGYLYKNWRNKKHQDATTFELLNDDAATVDQKATVSDDGTDLNKGEMGTGP